MPIITYGVIDHTNTHKDASKTFLGAKQYATRNDFKKVSQRIGYTATVLAVKTPKGWVYRDNLIK